MLDFEPSAANTDVLSIKSNGMYVFLIDLFLRAEQLKITTEECISLVLGSNKDKMVSVSVAASCLMKCDFFPGTNTRNGANHFHN